MGKLQQVRSKAVSLRGALALGGAVVVAASMTQVVGTLAAPDEVRTAKLGTSTQNYFPTPLPASISCSDNYELAGNTGARVTWPSAGAGMKYRVVILRDNDVGQVREDFYTESTSYRYRGTGSLKSDRIRIYTVNIASGLTDATRVQSSGFVSHTAYVTSGVETRCSGAPRYDAPNEGWENQTAGGATIARFAAGPATPMFATLMHMLNSDEALEPLPEETELADLEAAARPGPTPTDEAQPTETPASTTATSPASASDEAAPDTETEDGSKVTASSSTRTSPPGPATSTPGTTTPAATATPSRAVPAATKATVSATRTTTADPQPTTAPPATTTASTVRAGVGDDPIAVGANFARLDEADGRPQLVITTAGGAQVCTADLPGATRITSAAGKLTITVDGRTHTVDTGTCAID